MIDGMLSHFQNFGFENGFAKELGMWKLFPLMLFFLVIMFSCTRNTEETRNIRYAENSAGPGGPAAVQQTRQTAETVRRVVLLKGNSWINGISVFGENSFSSLYGEYRLEGAAAPHEVPESPDKRDFKIQVTRESLYFSEEWQSWPGTESIRVYHRSDEEGFHGAAIMEGSQGAAWTAVFQFPRGLEEAGLSTDAFNQLVRAWTGRFLYFLSLSKAPSDLSLPAALEF